MEKVPLCSIEANDLKIQVTLDSSRWPGYFLRCSTWHSHLLCQRLRLLLELRAFRFTYWDHQSNKTESALWSSARCCSHWWADWLGHHWGFIWGWVADIQWDARGAGERGQAVGREGGPTVRAGGDQCVEQPAGKKGDEGAQGDEGQGEANVRERTKNRDQIEKESRKGRNRWKTQCECKEGEIENDREHKEIWGREGNARWRGRRAEVQKECIWITGETVIDWEGRKGEEGWVEES